MADILITCEHAGRHIPEQYGNICIPADVDEHRIYDRYAIEAAEHFAQAKGLSVHAFYITRLLIDANRSLHTSSLFSEFSRKLTAVQRMQLIGQHYLPFRIQILSEIEKMEDVIHLSFHSFTPILNDHIRSYDAGILYAPGRSPESDIAKGLIKAMNETGISTVANKPYKGTADGHTTALRKEFPPSKYTGIEIELNQKLPLESVLKITDVIASYF